MKQGFIEYDVRKSYVIDVNESKEYIAEEGYLSNFNSNPKHYVEEDCFKFKTIF